MKLIENSWYRKFGFTWLLLPLSLLVYLIAKYRFFTKRRLQTAEDTPKIIVVGNIAVGGTGKTPFTLFLVEWLQKKGLSVAVISRGYGGKQQATPLLVDENITAKVAGDEPKLIALRTQVPVVVCPKRNLSIAYIKQQYNVDVIIADDGLQHYQMPRAIELCIVDNQRQFGNRLVLPAGPLREPISRLNSVDLTIFNGNSKDVGYQLQVDGVYRVADQQRVSDLSDAVTLVSAIGNPQRFEHSVMAQGINVNDHKIHADHHNYNEHDFAAINGAVLMTEKDAVKCQSFAKANWYYLKVSAVPNTHLIDKLNQLFKNKGIY